MLYSTTATVTGVTVSRLSVTEYKGGQGLADQPPTALMSSVAELKHRTTAATSLGIMVIA